MPLEAVDTGRLWYGNGNPEPEASASLTGVHVDPGGNVVEGRIPWVLLNVADPSSKQRIATDRERGLETAPEIRYYRGSLQARLRQGLQLQNGGRRRQSSSAWSPPRRS